MRMLPNNYSASMWDTDEGRYAVAVFNQGEEEGSSVYEDLAASTNAFFETSTKIAAKCEPFAAEGADGA